MRVGGYYYLIKIFTMHRNDAGTSNYLLHLQKLFITIKSFETAMVSNQPNWFYQKKQPKIGKIGLDHTALQYLTEIER